MVFKLGLEAQKDWRVSSSDRGYIDYRQFARWTKAGIFFVTRLKENADYWGFEDRPLPKNGNELAAAAQARLLMKRPLQFGQDARIFPGIRCGEQEAPERAFATTPLGSITNCAATMHADIMAVASFGKAAASFCPTSDSSAALAKWKSMTPNRR